MMFREQQKDKSNKRKRNAGPSSIENLRTCMQDIISERKEREASKEFSKDKQSASAVDGIE